MKQIQYRPTDDNTGFEPVEVQDLSQSISANNQRLGSAENELLNSMRANRSIAIENSKRVGDIYSALGDLSKTAADFLEKEVKRRADADMEEGMMLAYSQGVSADEQQAFNDEEAALVNADTETNVAGAEYETQTGDLQTGQRIRGLSGWKAYGYARGMAQKAGNQYPAYFEQAKSSVSVVVNGEEITYDTAKDPAERALVEQQIRRTFLNNFRGTNPALLNKYLFPQMQAFEAREFTRWNRENSERIKSDRYAENKDELYAAFRSGNGGQAIQEFIQRNKGDQGYGKSTTDAFAIAAEFISDPSIPLGEREAFLKNLESTVIPDHTSNVAGATTTIGKLYGRRLGALKKGMTDAIEADTSDRLSARQRDELQARETFEAAARAKGGLLNEAELEVAITEWNDKFPGRPVPQWMKGYVTLEDRQEDQEQDYLKEIISRRGYLIESDLKGMSFNTRQAFQGTVKRDADFAPSRESVKAANAAFKPTAESKADTTVGDNGIGNELYQDIMRRADVAYQRAYRSFREGGASELEAQEKAIAQVREKIEKGELNEAPPYGDQYSVREYANAQAQLQTNPRSWETEVLSGTDQSLQALTQYRDTGVGRIPEIYYTIADGQKNATAWDIADAQLRAATGTGLVPNEMQGVERVNPEVERLLKFKPTASRTIRASVVSTGGNPNAFLKLVASVESDAYGGYDAYNLGGSDGGHRAHGSGNSAKDNRYGAPLSSLTVADVMSLGSQGKIWAAGKYQFIPSTLKETVQFIGLDPNSPFSPEVQDQLAMGRMRWRTQVDPGLAGLRREWIGLNNVSDQEIIDALEQTTPYYSRTSNLTPGVSRQLAYITGNVGPTSTGQHLDVKQVGGGRFNLSVLDEFVEVDDKEFGTVALSQLRKLTNNVGDSFDEHLARGSHGIDVGTYSGSKLYVKNGAEVVRSSPTQHGELTTIQLPDGQQYTFLHGYPAG